jgi:hypothetical protein
MGYHLKKKREQKYSNFRPVTFRVSKTAALYRTAVNQNL